MRDRFESLPWFLKEYIHGNRWQGFREIQERAFDILRGSDSHLLISSGTSSGKTEAALFPAVSSIFANPPSTIGILYVGPLKALIDDQFRRMEPMLKDSYIKVTGWHGDVGLPEKEKLLECPSGILQITPESLQNIIASRPDELERLFGELRFVIIDEVHAFMGSERGLQLLCCLERLEMLAGCDPRRIGLSATVSDPGKAEEWISADTGRKTVSVTDKSVGGRDLKIFFNYFPAKSDPERIRVLNRYYRELYSQIRGKNCIVFTNSRLIAERTGRSLSKIASKYGDEDFVFVHHGSISKELRKEAEENLKSETRKTAAVATVTLELGIDIGSLDAVVQIDAPYTCSSLVQRMGRSGRRGDDQVMRIFCRQDADEWWSDLEGIPVDFLKAVAMASLILEDRWTETEKIPSVPFSLLFHQTMEYIKFGTGARFSDLVSDVLSMYPFRNISKEDYAVLVKHLISKGILLKSSDGTLLLTDQGERIVMNRDFCSVFNVRKEIEVKFEGKPLGSIQEYPETGDLILLAGKIWSVKSVDTRSRSVEVAETDGNADTVWKSGTPATDDRIMQRIKEILESDRSFGFLDEDAAKVLEFCRNRARSSGILDGYVKTEYGFRVYPWVGTESFKTLCRAFRIICGKVYERPPYYADIRTDLGWDDIWETVAGYSDEKFAFELMRPEERLFFGKYDKYIPEELLFKSFSADVLDFSYRKYLGIDRP